MRFPLLLLALLLPAATCRAIDTRNPKSSEAACRLHLSTSNCNDPEKMKKALTLSCEDMYPMPVAGDPPSLVDPKPQQLACLNQRQACLVTLTNRTKDGCTCVQAFPQAANPPPASPGPRPDPVDPKPDPVGRPAKPAKPVEEPGGPPLDTSHCQGSESCLSDAARRQREAEEQARQRQREMERYAKDSQRTKNSSITSAADFLDQWERAIANNPRATQSEITRYQADRRLVERAIMDPSFSRQDAQAATVRGLRGDLGLFAENVEGEKYYQKEADKAADDQKKLGVLAKETESRVRNLGAAAGTRAPAAATQPLPEPVAGFAAPKAGGGNHSTIAASRPDGLSAGGSTPAQEKGGGAVGADAGPAASAAGFRAGAGGGRNGPSLRDILKQRLAESGGGHGRGTPGGASAGSGPDRAGGGPRGPDSGNAGVAAEVLAGAESGQLGTNFPAFGIGSEETGQQMRRMMGEAGIEGDTEHTGLLGMNTVSLFERVRQAHRSCEAQGCVRQAAAGR